jgi:hypothetical protein
MIKACTIPVCVAILAAIWACDDTVKFTTKFASDVAPARRTVSILGVYKDGRMSVDGWAALAPHVTTAFGGGDCAVGYDTLATANQNLAAAIDDYAQADGPTDDLLAQLAPAARGDSILVLTFAGTLPQHGIADAGARSTAPPSMGSPRGGGRMGGSRGGGRAHGAMPAPEDPNALDISASLYSVRDSRSIALLSLEYTGASVEDALTKFATKLAASFPQAVCAGWNWDAKIDPDRIRQSAEE